MAEKKPITRMDAIEALTTILHDFVMRRNPTNARQMLMGLVMRLDQTDMSKGDWVQ